MHIKRTSIALAVVALLSSCSTNAPIQSDIETNPKEQNQDPENIVPPNVVKVLNRVTCENIVCTQENINKMWQICLSKEWSEEPTKRKVRTSRDLRELVTSNATYTELIYENIEKTDPSGVVTTVPTQKSIERTAVFTGYCIGTEYIVD